MGYQVNLRCLSHECLMLIGSQLDPGMAIMWGMRSQVCCPFDVAAAHSQSWFCCKFCWIPLKAMDNFKLDFCSEFYCYRKINFILLFTESHRSLCHKIYLNPINSWGQYLSPLILDESWFQWYQNYPEQVRILKI